LLTDEYRLSTSEANDLEEIASSTYKTLIKKGSDGQSTILPLITSSNR
jgi:hypothetical protein